MASCASCAVADAAFRPRLPSGSGPTSPEPKRSVACFFGMFLGRGLRLVDWLTGGGVDDG